jgi:hypothetical protein
VLGIASFEVPAKPTSEQARQALLLDGALSDAQAGVLSNANREITEQADWEALAKAWLRALCLEVPGLAAVPTFIKVT